ncbi:MAG: hypothetical protein U0441_38285 [Polyangiaceae bacterium]
MGTSKLIKDLSHVPNIVAGLGLGIAEAQSHFDLQYVRALERIAVLAQSMYKAVPAPPAGGPPPAGGTPPLTEDQIGDRMRFVREMLMALAPPHYQFTETTLDVKLDLAQSLDLNAEVGVSAGVGAVAVNASLAVAYGYDYRAAAECRTVLHAVLPDRAAMLALLARAGELTKDELKLPARTEIDRQVEKSAQDVFNRMFGTTPQEIGTR